jgi:uncharacterized phage protein (TIGR01671 family)
MRETKFRVWDNRLKRWHDPRGVVIRGDGEVFLTSYCDEDGTWHIPIEDEFPIDIEISFCTEQKDKNGKEIYEGDIIEYYYFSGIDEELIRLPMIWEDNVDYDGLFTMSGWRLDTDSYEVEVIGNIYEHPNLLL